MKNKNNIINKSRGERETSPASKPNKKHLDFKICYFDLANSMVSALLNLLA